VRCSGGIIIQKYKANSYRKGNIMKKIEGFRPQTLTTKWYKSAKLPWAIILIVTIFMLGVSSGWMLRSDVNAKIDSAVAAKFERLK